MDEEPDILDYLPQIRRDFQIMIFDDYGEEQKIQQQQHEHPCYYSPRTKDSRFTHTQYWSWGIHYAGRMHVVLDQTPSWPFDSLIDVGYSDCRFMREVHGLCSDINLFGVDYSGRSVTVASGMIPCLYYEAHH